MSAARPDLSRWARTLPLEWLLALRFLREGRLQSSMVLAGVTAGVAVTVFLTQLIAQLQSTIVDRVMGSQPHVVIAVQRNAQEMRARPGWAGLAALREGRVCALEPARYEVLVRPGPRLGEAALRMADCLATLPGRAAVPAAPAGPAAR